ncbi:hypothetical protein [Shewanella subflava]|uniref:Uncharacterized protein n=1 Tax=Shewanella subflava TaxID=2986476 RepID=A0ABT3ICI6_9GAMM|nr:hypothetical protein [Shewanella subflava]MCW3173757.1 hypothetical protein [Shewanella subflava]
MMHDIKFQARHAWYQSRFRALIKWLLTCLGLWVGMTMQELPKTAKAAFGLMPFVLALFYVYLMAKFFGVING